MCQPTTSTYHNNKYISYGWIESELVVSDAKRRIRDTLHFIAAFAGELRIVWLDAMRGGCKSVRAMTARANETARSRLGANDKRWIMKNWVQNL